MDLNKDTASPRKMKRGRTDADVVLVVRGTVIDAPELGTLRVLEKAVLGVDASGRVAFCEDGHDEELAVGDKLTLRDGGVFELPAGCTIRSLPPRGFLCPGFVDTHTHAPQFSFAGVGYDLQLLDWLNKYTFPSEAKFEDPTFAARVCRNAVARTLHHGTTTALYFATIHTDAALQLGRIASGLGQRAFVGKVNMDRNAPDFYRARQRSPRASIAPLAFHARSHRITPRRIA
jgi:guanine deaminase